MTISCKKPWILLIDKGMTKTNLAYKNGFSSFMISEMSCCEMTAMSMLSKFCDHLDCELNDLVKKAQKSKFSVASKGKTATPKRRATTTRAKK